MIDRAVLNRQDREQLKSLLIRIRDHNFPEHEEIIEAFLARQLLSAFED